MELGEEVNLLRCIKTEEEREKVAKAEAIGDQAFQKILGDIKPGVTELTIAAKLDYYMRELGAEGNSFDTIVASGLHSAMPHAVPTAKKLEKGDFITMDFGCRYDGYCSDMTRTVVLGEASSKQKEIYGIVLKAQMAALEQICAGKTGSEVDLDDRLHDTLFDAFHTVKFFIENTACSNRIDGFEVIALPLNIKHDRKCSLCMSFLFRSYLA